MLLWQEPPDRLPHEGGAAEPASDHDLEAGLPVIVLVHAQPDVVHPHGGPISWRRGHCNLELAREERELRVQRRPLADDLAVDARVLDLVRGGSRVLVRRYVAERVATGLDAVHLDLRQLGQDVGRLFQLRPVELKVLARGEVAVALVVAARDECQLAELGRGQRSVGNRYPQHVGVQLQVEPVQEAQRLELLLAELAVEAPLDLAPELLDALVDQPLIEFVVLIHPRPQPSACLPRSLRTVGPAARICSRVWDGPDARVLHHHVGQVGIHDLLAALRFPSALHALLAFGLALDDPTFFDDLGPVSVSAQEDDAPIYQPAGDHDLGHGLVLR